MKVAAIISEYNPFHNGHLYQINKVKELTKADYTIAIMSGNFVQRGEPAIINKYARTHMALNNGIDLVIELPTYYATASAEYFAYGAVSILNKLNIVDFLCFGSECNDIDILKRIANLLIEEPPYFTELLANYLKEGYSFPKARELSIVDYLSSNHTYTPQKLTSVLSSPNNILGIEYLKAIQKLESPIKPITILREGAGYNTLELPSENEYASASSIREILYNKKSPTNSIAPFVPENVYEIIRQYYNISYPIHLDDFSPMLYHNLLYSDTSALIEYLDIDKNLANKFLNGLDNFSTISEYIAQLKTKEITYSRICRSTLHILLNIKTQNIKTYLKYSPDYMRILGFKRDSSDLIKTIKKHANITIINKISIARQALSPIGNSMLDTDIKASQLYNQIIQYKYHTKEKNEYQKGVIIS